MPARRFGLLAAMLFMYAAVLVAAPMQMVGTDSRSQASGASPGQATGAVERRAPALVSVASGPSGEVRGGRMFIPAPRTRFRVPEDTTVVVAFEWIGVPGTYRFSGTWRGPGGTSTTSEFDYTARDRRFSAYWQLPISPSVPLGNWTLEARIDGQLAGTHEFQILGMDAAPAPAAPARRLPLERRDAFARALATTARIEAIGVDGSLLDSGPATLLGQGLIVASFSRINNAVRVRVRGPSGEPVELHDLLAFNRRQDWVLFRAPGVVAPTEAAVASEPVQAGDSCYSVSVSSDLTLTVSAGEVVGATEHQVAGSRLIVSFFTTGGSAGAPVINEYGDLIGVVAAGMLPGGVDLKIPRVGDLATLRTPVIPVRLLPTTEGKASPMSLSALAEQGQYIPRETMQRQVMSGGFASGLLRDGARSRPIDQRAEFSKQDATVTAFVNWLAVEPFRGTTVLRLYDIDNRSLAESKPSKLSLRKGDITISTWELPRPAPGIYRVDVLLGSNIAWRGYFRVD